MVIIFENLSADQADTYRLVLSSYGISYRSKKGKHGWSISVNDTEYEKALNTIEQPRLIQDAGYTAVQRDYFYNSVN
ncbi:MAG: hypothetical protein L6247_04190 [Desulfobacteraceae bacterium]|nr:hypothetical protein [Pseudomonadota bacterium]MBU4462895.1 hypothetical protein [Pseudomonadota bacterium]MCG2754757.1 hypothetical protein [Desulfobacteraceae bacterium]